VRFPFLLALAAASSAATARAQTRPLATEEAHTAPRGRITLEAGAQAIRDEPNFLTGRPRDRWDAPELRLVFSPADNVEVDVEWTARVGARGDADFGDVSDFGDVALRAKVRLAGDAGSGGALAARFGVTLPQTSFGNGLGPNTLRMAAQLLGSKALGAAVLHLNGGLALHDEPLRAHEQRDFFAYGAALEAPLGALTILGEVAGLAGRGAPGADSRAEARAGARIGRGGLVGDAAVRRGIGDAAGGWGVTAGVRWTARK
jgi:hypothetical protein